MTINHLIQFFVILFTFFSLSNFLSIFDKNVALIFNGDLEPMPKWQSDHLNMDDESARLDRKPGTWQF